MKGFAARNAIAWGTMSADPRRAAPPPGSEPNYLLRRLGALGVLVLVGYCLVVAIGSFVSSDDPTAGPDVSTVPTEPLDNDPSDGDPSEDEQVDIDCRDDANRELCDQIGFGDDVVVTEPEGPPATEAETPTTDADDDPDEPVVTGPPTSNNPASVYIVGDSDAGTFGPYLETLLDGTLIAKSQLNYKVSSGLARPDFFDWPSELRTKLPEVDPDIVVVTFGGNDSQGLRTTDLEWVVNDPLGNETAWLEEYERRAGEVMDILLENDRAVIWVGIPNDDNPEVTQKLALQDQAAKAAAAARPGVVFIDTWARFSGRDGGWAEFVIDPRDQTGKDVRAADGFHLNQNGAEILAIDIAVAVQEELRAMGAAI